MAPEHSAIGIAEMANDDTVASPEQPDEDFDDTTEDTPAEEQDGPSWAEEDFSPLFIDEHGGYVRDGGRTLRRTSTGLVVVCGFVPELLGEIVIERKLDQPGTDIGHSLVVRYETPEGHRTTARVAIDELSPAAAIIKHAPGAAARASVARPGEIALAATAFKAAAFFSQTHYGQVGWTRDGNYAFPGSEDVSLDHLGQGKGLQLLRIPSAPDPATFRLAAETLLTIVKSAPARTTLLMLGTLAAGPVFRSEYHLGARAFITMMTGRSGVGKTTLLRRVSGLIGDFHRQPGAILARALPH